MVKIETLEDISRLREEEARPADVLALIERRLRGVIRAFAEAGAEWTAEEYGPFVIVEQTDDVRDFQEVGLNPEDQGLVGALWEVATWYTDVRWWDVLILFGGDAGLTVFVPDAEWLDPVLRAKLEAEAEPEISAAP